MLVLSRKKNDSIVINGNITIEVVQVKGNQVRLGIKAPRSVRVLRGELTPFEVFPNQDSNEETAAVQLSNEKAVRELPGELSDDQLDEIDLMLDLAQLVSQAG